MANSEKSEASGTKSREELLREFQEAKEKIALLEGLRADGKTIEAALQESEQRFRNIIQALPIGIHMYELQPGGRLVFGGANPAADRILGVDNSRFIGKTIEEAFPPLSNTEVPERYRHAAAAGEPWHTEEITYQDQEISGVFEVYAFQTKPNAMAALFLDITERKKAEEALRFTQFTIDRMSDAAFWMGPDARFIYVNEAACRSLGYSKEELLAMSVHDIDPNFPADVWPTHWQDIKEKGSFSFESNHRTKDGRVFPVEITVNYMEFAGVEYNCASARNITTRKLAEQELKTSEEKYRQLVELSNDAIYILFNRKFVLINEKFKEMFKVTLEYVNSPDFDFLELVAPKSRPLIEERNRKMARGEKLSPHYSFTALSKDLREIDLDASVTYVKYKDGTAVQGILRDVSERKIIEEKLRQAQKMEAIGTLAGGIAHDFNNLLMGVQGRTSLVLLQPNLPTSIVEHLRGIEEYIHSATDLTMQLLGFARGGKYEVKPININTLIARNTGMFGRTRKEINIHEKYQPDIWTVEVDEGQIDQVFLNLFVNAWQAMPGGGQLYLETQNVKLDESETRLFQARPGKYVKISVTDTGVGMDEATKEKIFDPFFTTKKMGRGTGLGLATVYGILKNHNGFINVYSEKGQGTAFNIYLPASTKKPKKKTRPLGAIEHGSGTILLVDDEEIIIEVSQPMLESLGYRVLAAVSGEEALEVYRNNKGEIDLVILDMIMPDLGGGETYDRLKEIDPQVRVLLSSGYSLNSEAASILERGCKGFIQKPFNVGQVSAKIREVLEEK